MQPEGTEVLHWDGHEGTSHPSPATHVPARSPLIDHVPPSQGQVTLVRLVRVQLLGTVIVQVETQDPELQPVGPQLRA